MNYKKGIIPSIYLKYLGTLRKIDEDILSFMNEQNDNLETLFDKGLGFTDNFDGVFVTFTSNAIADTEDDVTHTLKKIPTGFIVTSRDKGAVLYDGGTTNTTTKIYLKSNVASTTYKIFIF